MMIVDVIAIATDAIEIEDVKMIVMTVIPGEVVGSSGSFSLYLL
jgi:hypothetical protein